MRTIISMFALLYVLMAGQLYATTPLADYVLFGIDGSNGNLIRHDFSTGQTTVVGPIQDASGNSFPGIEGSAYVPGNNNIVAFWKDPSDGQTKLLYINIETARAAVVGADLGDGIVNGAVALKPPAGSQHVIYAVQEAETIDFNIEDGSVVGEETFAARVTVLGAAISAGGEYDIPVTVRVDVDSDSHEPFGSFTSPIAGNVNDGNNPRNHVLPEEYPTNTRIAVSATSWIKKNSSNDGSQASHWEQYLSFASDDNTPHVKVLRDGDDVPPITPFLNQGSITSFVSKYVDSATGKITLDKNQAIYLFELGTTNLSSSAADFQDLVVLVTLAKHRADLAAAQDVTVVGTININPNNSEDNRFFLVAANGSVITRDDLVNATLKSDGVLFDGAANLVRVRPHGNGSQNELAIDGQPYDIKNNTTYTLTGALNATVYNAAVDSNGKATGQWKVVFTEGPAVLQDPNNPGDGDPPKSRLIQVDHRTGQVVPLIALDNIYDGLAAVSNDSFFATKDNNLYLINPLAQTETQIGQTAYDQNRSLEFAGSMLLDFSTSAGRLIQTNAGTGSTIGNPINVGVNDLRSIILVNASDLPDGSNEGYD